MKRILISKCKECNNNFVLEEGCWFKEKGTCSPHCAAKWAIKLNDRLNAKITATKTILAPVIPIIQASSIKKSRGELKKERIKLKKARHNRFFRCGDWLELRYKVLKKYGPKCMLCGETKGAMHVDHIKPKSKYPELALVFSNLQVLCSQCNLGKSNKDETDYRPKVEVA